MQTDPAVTKMKDIYWLAGLIEGEGTFYSDEHYPRLQIVICDLDIITRAHKILNCTSNIKVIDRELSNHKVQYSICLAGHKAIGWMFTLYSLMGQRRKAKILEVVEAWKSYSPLNSRKNHRVNIRFENGKRICVIHGPVDKSNIIYGKRRSVYCKGCHNPTTVNTTGYVPKEQQEE